jgi:hypothetical protein
MYLWHWPFIFLAKYLYPDNPTIIAVALGATTLSAAITYRFVEAPLRIWGRTQPKYSTQTLAASLFLSSSLIGVLGSNVDKLGDLSNAMGLWSEVATGPVGQEAFLTAYQRSFFKCGEQAQAVFDDESLTFERCLQSQPERQPTFVIVGDSHAEHLFFGFAQLAQDDVVAYFIIENSLEAVITDLLDSRTVHSVVVSMYWERTGFPTFRDTSLLEKMEASRVNFYFADGVPTFPYAAETCKYEFIFSGRDPIAECHAERSENQVGLGAELLNLSVDVPSFTILPTYDSFCQAEKCSMLSASGAMLFRDKHHLTLEGSLLVAENLPQKLPNLLK